MAARFIFLFLMCGALLQASDFSASVELSSNKVRVDDELFITVTLYYPDEYNTSPSEMVARLLERGTLAQPPFAFVETKVLSQENRQGVIEEVIQFELDPQVIGNHPLSFFGIPFYPESPQAGQYVELISPVFNVQVVPAPSDPAYRGVVAPPLTFDPTYPILPNLENRRRFIDLDKETLAATNQKLWQQKQIPLIPMAVFGIVILLLYFVRQKPRPETKEQRTFRARKEALERLDTLREKRLPQRAEFERYFVELSETVRTYLEEYYELPAPKQTTREFLHDLSGRSLFDKETNQKLKEFLRRADLVKFACYSPTKDECAYAEISAKKLIDPD